MKTLQVQLYFKSLVWTKPLQVKLNFKNLKFLPQTKRVLWRQELVNSETHHTYEYCLQPKITQNQQQLHNVCTQVKSHGRTSAFWKFILSYTVHWERFPENQNFWTQWGVSLVFFIYTYTFTQFSIKWLYLTTLHTFQYQMTLSLFVTVFIWNQCLERWGY